VDASLIDQRDRELKEINISLSQAKKEISDLRLKLEE